MMTTTMRIFDRTLSSLSWRRNLSLGGSVDGSAKQSGPDTSLRGNEDDDDKRSKRRKEEEKTTHFGYQTVTEEEKKTKVLDVFHNVADKYDLMNDAMSSGIHRLWKDHFVRTVLDPSPGTRVLDVAGGTGDIAFRIIEQMRKNGRNNNNSYSNNSYSNNNNNDNSYNNNNNNNSSKPRERVVVCDINASMLEVGKKRAERLGYAKEELSWVEGDAQRLSPHFEDASFDAYTIAFGIRNVVRIEEVLAEAYRVLRPGGRFLCLEFTPRVDNPVLGPLYDLYSFHVIPPLGKVLSGDWDSYQYLVESIRRFPDQETFEDMIEGAGFRAVGHEDLTFGVAAIHSGFKL